MILYTIFQLDHFDILQIINFPMLVYIEMILTKVQLLKNADQVN